MTRTLYASRFLPSLSSKSSRLSEKSFEEARHNVLEPRLRLGYQAISDLQKIIAYVALKFLKGLFPVGFFGDDVGV